MKKKQNPKKQVHQLILGKQRTQQVEQGYFDGRFVQRAEPSKKIYRREKNKRWGEEWTGGGWLISIVYNPASACIISFFPLGPINSVSTKLKLWTSVW